MEEFGNRVKKNATDCTDATDSTDEDGREQERRTTKEEALTQKVIGIFYTVYNDLGHGFLESIYQKAFALQLSKQAISFEQQKGLRIRYLGVDLGEFCADLVIESKVIVELKAVTALEAAHDRQLLNYLKASGIEVGLLLNFGPKPQVRRMIFDRDKKPAELSASAGSP